MQQNRALRNSVLWIQDGSVQNLQCPARRYVRLIKPSKPAVFWWSSVGKLNGNVTREIYPMSDKVNYFILWYYNKYLFFAFSSYFLPQIHPEYPKKPVPPTAAYCGENLAKFRMENPELRTSKVFKFAVEQFSQLPDDEKVWCCFKMLTIRHKATNIKKQCFDFLQAEYGRNFNLATEEYGKMMEDFRYQMNSHTTHFIQMFGKVSVTLLSSKFFIFQGAVCRNFLSALSPHKEK